MRRVVLSMVAALALSGAACHSNTDAVMLVVVTVSGTPPPVSALTVTIMGPAGVSSQSYPRPDGEPIAFPTTLGAELPPSATGDVSVAITAVGPTGQQVAAGRTPTPTSVGAGGRPTVYVMLTCGGVSCTPGLGAGSGADGGTDAAISPRCGNGRIDPGETCDIAIAPGDPGACPPADCDDGVSCTTDTASGSGCQLYCTHVPITDPFPNDGCCPAGTTHATDPDCSPTCGDGVVQPGETCDTAIAPGLPGACPTPGECTSTDPCAVTELVSGTTCQAICMHYQWTLPQGGDGCCPPGANNAVDPDCPQSCGDGVVGTGESCDLGITPPAPGSCPTSCDDGLASTTDFMTGAGCTVSCSHVTITAPISGDGWCPAHATHDTDTDCPATCGDGVVEPGESCDSAAVGTGACPASCPPPSPSACLVTTLTGSATACTAACVSHPIATCSPQSDGCCPAGCTAVTDPDCSATCGDGKVQTNETCDVAIAAGSPGACPTGCDDGDPCTTDYLLSGGTCQATCAHVPVTAFVAGDGCCPPGGDLTLDIDCPAVCGDGVVDRPVETCDKAVAGSCPTSCPPANACAPLSVVGSPSTCSSLCVATPITTCSTVVSDKCCPQGCTSATDSDCPAICGDGVVAASEQCDRAITAGMPGACAETCDDGDACTTDVASGLAQSCTRHCTHFPIVACLNDDGCCPAGCTPATDSDCAPICGDGHVGAGETCDPPGTCPTTCPDDGDPCTEEELVGSPATCNSACLHLPITTCSTAVSDHCCPTGCTSATDSDC
jgi:hypothetical protein